MPWSLEKEEAVRDLVAQGMPYHLALKYAEMEAQIKQLQTMMALEKDD